MYQHHPKRHLVNRAAPWSAEELERRTLLTGGVFDVSKVPNYVPTSADISDVKNGPLGNFGAHLAGLYTEYKHFLKDGGAPGKFRSKTETLLQYNHGKAPYKVRHYTEISHKRHIRHKNQNVFCALWAFCGYFSRLSRDESDRRLRAEATGRRRDSSAPGR